MHFTILYSESIAEWAKRNKDTIVVDADGKLLDNDDFRRINGMREDESDGSLHTDNQTQRNNTTPASSLHSIETDDVPETESEESEREDDRANDDSAAAMRRQVTDRPRTRQLPQSFKQKRPTLPFLVHFFITRQLQPRTRHI
jgi:lipopolysaccharide export LptBFGC system permease protein LptF